eukprot:g47823.t1
MIGVQGILGMGQSTLVKQQTLSTFRFVYTAGYTLSLITLIGASLTLISFRKLHCMRNYIHLNLFGSFILRAIAVLVKDVLMDNLHAGNGNVSVELQTADPDMKCFLVYLLIGWGVPLIFVFPWIIVKFLQENS